MTIATQLPSGQQGFTAGVLSDSDFGANDLASLLGNHDVLAGGDENFLVGGLTSDTIVTLGAIQTGAVTGPAG